MKIPVLACGSWGSSSNKYIYEAIFLCGDTLSFLVKTLSGRGKVVQKWHEPGTNLK